MIGAQPSHSVIQTSETLPLQSLELGARPRFASAGESGMMTVHALAQVRATTAPEQAGSAAIAR
jgi:hypothetical protein